MIPQLKIICAFKLLRDEIWHISGQIAELAVLFEYQNNEEIVKFMKGLVPEFLSNNSEFEKLDK